MFKTCVFIIITYIYIYICVYVYIYIYIYTYIIICMFFREDIEGGWLNLAIHEDLP